MKSTKGIILAGGSGTRLYPMTLAVSKQLLPVYNKPMIYYPLSVLLLAGIREVLIITTPQDQPLFERLLGDGSLLGISIQYKTQLKPEGIAQAFLIGEEFIGSSNVCLVLGDNIFFGHGLPEVLQRAVKREEGATIFAYQVKDPERYGVVEIDGKSSKAISIVEKPKNSTSKYAVTGIYFYDNSVIQAAKLLKPSARGELEITDINNYYLKSNTLKVEKLGRGVAWLDTGTYESFLQAALFIQTLEERQGLAVACVEEIAFNNGFIDRARLLSQAEKYKNSGYGDYLRHLANL
jgi:glucose-1-phosphate thymidylyltransferase